MDNQQLSTLNGKSSETIPNGSTSRNSMETGGINSYKIYGLIDSRYPSTIRYIGKTKMSLKKRLQAHIDESKKGQSFTYKTNWIRNLLSQNIKPIIILIEECSVTNWQERERYWISKLDNLTNTTEGGEVIGYTTEVVYKYNLYGKFLKEYSSIDEACLDNNLKRGVINSALQRNSEGGCGGKFLWRHGKHIKLNLIPPYKNPKTKIIKVIDVHLNKEFLFFSLKEALINLNIKRSGNINRCIVNNVWYKNRYFFEWIN